MYEEKNTSANMHSGQFDVTAEVKQLVMVQNKKFHFKAEKTVYTHMSKKNSGIFSNNSVMTAG